MPKRRPVEKPYPDFPLFKHASGQWAKKILGKLHYFGTDPGAALDKYMQQRDELHAGRTPRGGEGLTVADLCNRYLTAKKAQMAAGELSPRSWRDYYRTCETLATVFHKTRQVAGLAADDFAKLRAKLAKTRGPVALGNEIQRVRTIFKFAFDDDLLDTPIRYGATFKKPARKVMRLARRAGGTRMIEAAECRKIVEACQGQLKAMVLLGLNAGLGSADVAAMPRAALDLKRGWLDYPRPKTGVERRVPLWPETVAAIREALPDVPAAKAAGDAGLCFITKYGKPWARVRVRAADDEAGGGAVTVDSVSLEFGKVVTALKLKRRGGFYNLRHVFQTVADGSRDQVAIDFIMGHARDDMASQYRERIDDDRLRAVVEHVRAWLFGKAAKAWPR